jgi:intracellular septation protein A
VESPGNRTLSGRSHLWQGVEKYLWRKQEASSFQIATILTGLLLFAVFLLYMGFVQFSTPDMPDNDGFYHIKMAYLMRTEGLKPNFPWLPLTVLNPREFYNHHFLFHVFLIPFTFGDLRLGAKFAAVLFSSLAFLSIWRLLDRQRVPYAALWSLGLLGISEAFIYRMSITRAQSLSLAVLAVGLLWLMEKKYTRLFFLGFAYVWFYNAFPLLILVAGVYTLAEWMIERRFDVRPVVYSTAGIAVGLIINPYFPYNITFALYHMLPKLLDTTAVSVGSEWFPYDTGQLLENSPLALVAFTAGALALGLSARRMDARTLATFLTACLFGLMLFQSRRFIEYFPAFALVFAAFAWSPLIQPAQASSQPALSSRHSLSSGWKNLVPPILVGLLFLIAGVWPTFQASRDSLQGSKPYQLYSGASAWLEANTPPGERVFQTDWDDFPRLFFYNTQNTYLVGLDPTYMQLYNASLYDRWVDITQGRVENPSSAILAEFGARYVLSDLLHDDFIAQAGDDPNMVEVFRDEDAIVYQVID